MREVLAPAHLGGEVAARRAHPLAVDLVHRVRAGAARRGSLWSSQAGECRPLHASRNAACQGTSSSGRVPADGDRAGLRRAIRRRRSRSVSRRLNAGQAALERPLGQAARGPLVVVVRPGRAARCRCSPPTSRRRRGRAGRRTGILPGRRRVLVAPVVRAHRVARSVAEIGGDLAVGVVGAGLDQEHSRSDRSVARAAITAPAEPAPMTTVSAFIARARYHVVTICGVVGVRRATSGPVFSPGVLHRAPALE